MKSISILITVFALITPLTSANLRGHRELQNDMLEWKNKAMKLFTDLDVKDLPLADILHRVKYNAKIG